MKIFALILICFGTFSSCFSTYPKSTGSIESPINPIKCYSKTYFYIEKPDQILEYPVYTGENKNIETTSINLEIGSKWTKIKKYDCQPDHSWDCMIWCLKKPTTKTLENILVDITSTEDYYWYELSSSETRSNGYSNFRTEVLCHEQITFNLMKEICIELSQTFKNTNLDCINNDRVLTTKMKKYLIQYQEKHFLPIGPLNLETLDYMGIEY